MDNLKLYNDAITALIVAVMRLSENTVEVFSELDKMEILLKKIQKNLIVLEGMEDG